MSRKFLRTISLKLSSSSQELDLSNMQVRFEIHQATTETPNWAMIRIYNLSEETQKKAYKEYRHVDLAVGYDGDNKRLFYGQIRQFNSGLRENARDTFIDLICQDGDYAYKWMYANKTLRAGWTYGEALAQLGKEFEQYGSGQNELPSYQFPATEFPRGRVLYGAGHDLFRGLSNNVNCDWSFKNGNLEVIPFQGVSPGKAVVLSPETGLIGLPQQTVDGITAKCLIDPRIHYGTLVQIDSGLIQAGNFDVTYGATNYLPSINHNTGLYKVFSINHTGDTRGNDWYSELICTANDGSPPQSGTYINAVPNHGQPRGANATTSPYGN